MWAYIAITIESLWIIYNHISVYVDLPVIMIGTGQWVLEVLAAMALKWSLFFGMLGLAVGLAGLIFHSKLDDRMDAYAFRLFLFYFFLSLCLIF